MTDRDDWEWRTFEQELSAATHYALHMHRLGWSWSAIIPETLDRYCVNWPDVRRELSHRHREGLEMDNAGGASRRGYPPPVRGGKEMQ